MKKFILAGILSAAVCAAWGQTKPAADTTGFGFKTVKENKITPVRNQASSSTCWCFSGVGLVEAELLRMGKGEFDLSEMYIVHRNYQDKAAKYVRMHGDNAFSPGGSFADVFDAMRDYGIVPAAAMPGLNYGEERHRHSEMDGVLSAYVQAVIKNPNKKLSTAWAPGLCGILDAYLGKCPETFTYGGKQYTPQTFRQSLGINAGDYISLSSFTHHPFYTQFAVEVPDNWRWAPAWNLPLDELMSVMGNALDKGYCVAWASDVSEKGFSRNGIAVVPDMEAKAEPGSDQAHWLGLNTKEREEALANLKQPVPEKKITQELRQQEFDNYLTTDDHGMLIYGTAKDKNGTTYYLVKNSWGTENPYKGTWYASDAFVRLNTINIVIHKDAIPQDIAEKLGIK